MNSSGLQHWGSSWKGTSGIWEENAVSGIRASAWGQLPLKQNSRGQAVAIVPFLSLPPQSHRVVTAYLRLYHLVHMGCPALAIT